MSKSTKTYTSAQLKAIESFMQALGNEISKLCGVTNIAVFGPLASPTVSIHMDLDDARTAHSLLHCFYYGTPWYCRLSSTPKEQIVRLHANLDFHEYKLDDLKREIDYKICLVKNTSIKRKGD